MINNFDQSYNRERETVNMDRGQNKAFVIPFCRHHNRLSLAQHRSNIFIPESYFLPIASLIISNRLKIVLKTRSISCRQIDCMYSNVAFSKGITFGQWTRIKSSFHTDILFSL